MAKPKRSIPELYTEARSGGRRALGRLLTVVERGGAGADEISELAHPDAGRAHVVGITGAPGAGKSTLTGELVNLLVDQGRRPAVLAVDPSSPLTGGAILGDRIRMEASPTAAAGSGGGGRTWEPTATDTAFIRSMATRGHSGGLALAVPLAVRLFDAVGYDPVIIETVGVGQVEVDVVGAADTAMVVMTPGMGDAVQANKAGLLEVADVFVVNKADRPGADDVRRDLNLMLDLSHMTGQDSETGYRPPIVMCSALTGTGGDEVWKAVEDHLTHLVDGDLRQARREHRIRTEITARLEQMLGARIAATIASEHGDGIVSEAERAEIPPAEAATRLFDRLLADG